MKLLVISHACVLPLHQSFYADLMSEKGWSVTLVTPSHWRTQYGKVKATDRWPGFKGRILRLNTVLTGDIPKHMYRSLFHSLILQENPDAIYVHQEPYGFSSAQIYLANQLAGKRPIGFYAAQNIVKRYPWPIRLLEQWVFRNSTFAFPVTKSALEVLRSKGYKHAAHVLPLALDQKLYSPNLAWAERKRSSLGFQADRFLIGYMGRLVEEKGLDTLLSAVAKLGNVPCELILVGAGPYEERLRRQVELLPSEMRTHVHFVGYAAHEDAPKWLSLFDVLVLPSETQPNWKEQFGRVLIEALACGTPVIGSDSGEIPNVISATGGGIVFAEGDANALAEALRTLAHSPDHRRTLSASGRANVIRHYDQGKLASDFALTIEQAIRGRALTR